MIARQVRGLLIGLWFIAPIATADGPFQDITFEDAVAKAAKQNKWVFVDFYTTWCAPCKMMDQSTFQDENVLKWLDEKAIAIKVDAEEEATLSARFGIDVYPTCLFLKPDGKEFERLLGFVPPEAMLRNLKLIEAGKTSLQLAAEQFNKDPNDPFARMSYAQELAQRSKWQEAWTHYKWCFENGTAKTPAFAPLVNTYLLESMLGVAQSDEDAWNYLAQQRDRIEPKLGNATATPAETEFFVNFCVSIGEANRCVKLLDRFESENNQSGLKQLRPAMLSYLAQQKEYDRIIGKIDLVADARGILSQMKLTVGALEQSNTIPDGSALAAALREMTAVRITDHYQVMLAAGQTQPAATLEKQIVELSSTPLVYSALAWSGFLSDKPVQANIEQAKKALTMLDGQPADIIDTLARLQHALGRTDEAIQTCQDALARTQDTRDRYILERCLADFRTARSG